MESPKAPGFGLVEGPVDSEVHGAHITPSPHFATQAWGGVKRAVRISFLLSSMHLLLCLCLSQVL